MSRFRSNLLIICLAVHYLDKVPKTDGSNEEKYNNGYYYKGEVGSKMGIPESIAKGKGIIGKFSKYKAEMDKPNSYKRGALKAADLDTVKAEPPAKKAEDANPKLPTKIPPIRQNETEAEKAERIHRTFEKLLTFVEIVGQVDNYVSTKWRNLIKTVSNLYEEENDDEYRLSLKRLKGCPAFLNES